MKRFIALTLAAALLLAMLAGCASEPVDLTHGSGRGVPTDAPTGEPHPVTSPEPIEFGSEPDFYELSGATFAEFGLELLKLCREGGTNTLVSPLSIICALAMTANGAEGRTLEQMQSVLGARLSDLNEYLREYMQNLPEEERYKLSLANSIWFREDKNFEVKQEFLNKNEEFYSAQLYEAAFDASTVRDINKWIDEHTDGMIKEIISDISPSAMMYLINALAFDAEWQDIYNEHQVREGVFTREDGSMCDVELMYSGENAYLEDEYATGFIKYYADNKYAFVGLLPNEGVSVDAYVDWLDGSHVAWLLENAQSHKVNAAIPKFESEYSTSLVESLQAMGMGDAFSPEPADFGGIGTYEDANLYIGDVLHKTFIKVDERGTKAGAATAVIVDATSAAIGPRVEPKTVYLDRPFVYMLIDCEKNLPFFIGTAESIGEPNGESIEPLVDGGVTLDPNALCGYPTVEAMNNEIEWIGVANIAEYPGGSVSMTIEYPEDWECVEVSGETGGAGLESIDGYGFELRPKGISEGSLKLICYRMFGVCGTGLTEEKVEFDSGHDANVGYYDGGDIWSFVAYDVGEREFDFVAMNEGMNDWYEDYEDTVWEILNRAKFEVDWTE